MLVEDINNQLNRLDPKKATPIESIPAKILKENSDIFLYLAENYFPSVLKDVDISSLFKKEDALFKKNYKPITVQPCASKIFEQVLFDAICRELFISFALCLQIRH